MINQLKNSSLLSFAVVMMSLFYTSTIHAQTSVIFNNGAMITVQNPSIINGTVSTTPTLFVKGTYQSDTGITNNAGEIQITGNLYLDNGSQWNSTGDDVFINTGTIVPFYNQYTQRIIGNRANALTGSNALYNMVIEKPARTSSNPSLIELGINVEVNNSIHWTGVGGVIRTDTFDYGNNGSLYVNYIHIKNGSPFSMSGYNWTSVGQWNNNGGSKDKYVEGRLKRTVDRVDLYRFPVGVSPFKIDGMEGVEVNFSNTPSGILLAYVQPATTPNLMSDLITNGEHLFYDIGSLPNSSPANQFPNCVGPPDGHDDIAIIDQATDYEWIMTLDNPVSVLFDLQVHPGPKMDNISYVSMGTLCNSVFQKAKYLARNGRIGGDESLGPMTNVWNPGITGLYQKPTGNIITGQTVFSRFRLFGTTDPGNTSLPVEMVSFTVTPIDNEYLKVEWSTASELQNDHFELERSIDGTSFSKIAIIPGHGTTAITQSYHYPDHDVLKNVVYYYRLKQVDIDQTYLYSNIVSGKLFGSVAFALYPNPTSGIMTVTDKTFSAIRVLNPLGQVVKQFAPTDVITISELAAGTYLFNVQFNNHIEQFKIVKN